MLTLGNNNPDPSQNHNQLLLVLLWLLSGTTVFLGGQRFFQILHTTDRDLSFVHSFAKQEATSTLVAVVFLEQKGNDLRPWLKLFYHSYLDTERFTREGLVICTAAKNAPTGCVPGFSAAADPRGRGLAVMQSSDTSHIQQACFHQYLHDVAVLALNKQHILKTIFTLTSPAR